ncbi:hypothetical protein P3384_22735 [Vibrio parahaemolyticus]|nr:hypothetical protein [Vibrio parahaemolyticus]MDF4466847.1 hypothetical protein [Vibrio parahaemolyticus]MDF4471573.1 hypothetical protein [Vibrio parahaemolyticus]MDF4494855.1 hypothetical protein [Vibrio parahaemolyticus]MDG2570468.1 hypothetical protein [Vibrio parahaemolyticus]
MTQITFTLDLSQDDEAELASILGCENNELADAITKCSNAATLEYLAMIRGQKVFKRGTDILEYRLLLLIQHHFGGVIPDEKDVTHLFQTTLTESRSLIRAVISKYQYLLRDAIDQTMLTVLNIATADTAVAPYEVVIKSQNIVDELNRLISDIDGNLPSVTKKRGSVATYEIKRSAYDQLRQRLDP